MSGAEEEEEGLWDANWVIKFASGFWMSGEGVADPVPPQFNMYVPNACHVCKRGGVRGTLRPPAGLKRCGGCKMVWYCCKDHQKEDWQYHKQTCERLKTVQEVMADSAARLFYNRERGSCEALKRYLQAGLLALVDLDSEGGKESNQSAVTMWSQQPYCGICFALGTDKELVPCFGCGSAPLCKECREAGGAAVKRGLHVNHTEKQCRMCCHILPQTPSQPRPGRAPPRALSPQPLAGTSSRPHVSE